jgi:hypothetical protein
MSEKWKNASGNTSDKHRCHELNIIKMKVEIIGHADGTEFFVSIRCSMDVSQMSIYSSVKKTNNII